MKVELFGNESLTVDTCESNIRLTVKGLAYTEKKGYRKAIKVPILNFSGQKFYKAEKKYGNYIEKSVIVLPKRGFIENVKALKKHGYTLKQL